MNILDAIFFALLQGIAEFLPISSSGHLIILKHLLNLQDIPKSFDILLHFASLLAIITVLFGDLKDIFFNIISYFKGNENAKYSLRIFFGVIISTILTILIYLIYKFFSIDDIKNIKIIGCFFLTTAFMLICSLFVKPKFEKITFLAIISAGIFQGFGIMPGISRSGATIFGAIITGVSLKESTRYSFLLAIPAILGAFVLSIKDLGAINVPIAVLALSFVVCYIVSFFCMKILLKIVSSGKYPVFSVYLIIIGITCFFIK